MEYKHFKCSSCNYKFKRKADASSKTCPYCGSKNVSEYKPTLAEDLLNSID